MSDQIALWMEQNPTLGTALTVVCVILLAFAAYFVAKRMLLVALAMMVRKTSFKWDDIIMERGVFNKLANLAPAIVAFYCGYLFEAAGMFIQRGAVGYMLLVVALALSDFLSATNDIYDKYDFAKGRSIKGYIQLAKIFVFSFAGIVVLAILLDKSPLVFISGLGAATAVILLIFKDTILSFVASIQIATTDLIRVGDWLEMPKLGADGDVIDIALHTVRIQNWDKTITAIPTHRLVSDPFKNWRGMEETKGRRIKRALYIDQTSVKFLDGALLANLKKVGLLTDYLAEKSRDIEAENAASEANLSSPINGRRLTNVGTFRAYLELYLQNHDDLRKDLTLLVRQLAPGDSGIPIEIYCFTADTAWAKYEATQADIFDHLLAVISEFDLRVFQNPSGEDFGRLS